MWIMVMLSLLVPAPSRKPVPRAVTAEDITGVHYLEWWDAVYPIQFSPLRETADGRRVGEYYCGPHGLGPGLDVRMLPGRTFWAGSWELSKEGITIMESSFSVDDEGRIHKPQFSNAYEVHLSLRFFQGKVTGTGWGNRKVVLLKTL